MFRSQARPGYESDKWRLMLLDRASGRQTSLTDAFDRSVEDARWSIDGKSILAAVGEGDADIVLLDGLLRRPATAR